MPPHADILLLFSFFYFWPPFHTSVAPLTLTELEKPLCPGRRWALFGLPLPIPQASVAKKHTSLSLDPEYIVSPRHSSPSLRFLDVRPLCDPKPLNAIAFFAVSLALPSHAVRVPAGQAPGLVFSPPLTYPVKSFPCHGNALNKSPAESLLLLTCLETQSYR